ncbi:MAG: filamentous hemagglutinin N-terminal domain-containing protein [Akkermansiaceae bacterium]|nr:filamentous hemagglutinin N-terminal domain-containing protein [Akkermansiaceae bacterium]
MKTPIRIPLVLLLASVALAIPQMERLRANPADGAVAFGGADFIGGNGRLTIRQTTDKAIINWGDFSIGKGELTEFIQPGANSAVLNRVITGNPSALDGALKANGKVILINPNGIIVGRSGTIDVGGLVLSTLDVADEDFIAGRDLIFKGETSAGVVNYGRINAVGGDVFLFGHTVANHGTISAPDGTVGLGAGSEILLTAEPNRDGERVFVRAGRGQRAATGVENTGTIEAAAIELKAHGNLYAMAINNSGALRATGANRNGGKVFLRAPGGAVSNTGTIQATVPGSRGGRILVESETFDLGGSLETDPEGSIDLLTQKLNLLPGAKIGGLELADVLVEMNDANSTLNADPRFREGTGHPASGTGTSIGPKGEIVRGGRLADGPAPIASTTKGGRVVIGMPGVTAESTIEPVGSSVPPVPPASAVPVEAGTPATEMPTSISKEKPIDPERGNTSPANNKKPPVPVPSDPNSKPSPAPKP